MVCLETLLYVIKKSKLKTKKLKVAKVKRKILLVNSSGYIDSIASISLRWSSSYSAILKSTTPGQIYPVLTRKSSMFAKK